MSPEVTSDHRRMPQDQALSPASETMQMFSEGISSAEGSVEALCVPGAERSRGTHRRNCEFAYNPFQESGLWWASKSLTDLFDAALADLTDDCVGVGPRQVQRD